MNIKNINHAFLGNFEALIISFVFGLFFFYFGIGFFSDNKGIYKYASLILCIPLIIVIVGGVKLIASKKKQKK